MLAFVLTLESGLGVHVLPAAAGALGRADDDRRRRRRLTGGRRRRGGDHRHQYHQRRAMEEHPACSHGEATVRVALSIVVALSQVKSKGVQ